MDRERLDARELHAGRYSRIPRKNGWSFSKKMCEFAVSRMKDRDGKKIEPITKEQIDKLLKTNGIELKHDNGYDCVYVANMARADYWGSSIADEQHLALFVGDFIDDEDAYPGCPSHDISPT